MRGTEDEPGGGNRVTDAPQMSAGVVEPGGGTVAGPADPVGRASSRGAETQQGGAGLALQTLSEQVCGPGRKSRCLHRSLGKDVAGGRRPGHAQGAAGTDRLGCGGFPAGAAQAARPADREAHCCTPPLARGKSGARAANAYRELRRKQPGNGPADRHRSPRITPRTVPVNARPPGARPARRRGRGARPRPADLPTRRPACPADPPARPGSGGVDHDAGRCAPCRRHQRSGAPRARSGATARPP